MGRVKFKTYRSLEFFVLFFGLPSLYMTGLIPIHVLGFLWLASFLAYAFLRKQSRFRLQHLWTCGVSKPHLKRVLLRFFFFAIGMTGFVYFFSLGKLFEFPFEEPWRWLQLMIFYPLFSVLPQSFIYRVFFVQRYERLFSSEYLLLIFGALSFMFMHLIFRNWVALAVTGIGGFLFLETYWRSRNYFLSAFEHALYGCFAFSVGLGPYLYSGSWAVVH